VLPVYEIRYVLCLIWSHTSVLVCLVWSYMSVLVDDAIGVILIALICYFVK
jgi:hypothetical protein